MSASKPSWRDNVEKVSRAKEKREQELREKELCELSENSEEVLGITQIQVRTS